MVPDIINSIIRREGEKFTNDPDDAGGPTKWGITQKTLSNFRGYPTSVEDVVYLCRREAYLIYEQAYINDPDFDHIKNEEIKEFMADSGVLYGPSDPIKWLQKILGTNVDGVLGPVTLRALERNNAEDILILLVKERITKIGVVVTSRPSQLRYLKGWLRRTLELI